MKTKGCFSTAAELFFLGGFCLMWAAVTTGTTGTAVFAAEKAEKVEKKVADGTAEKKAAPKKKAEGKKGVKKAVPPAVLARRIAANEAAAVVACRTYVTAQSTYRRTDYDGDGLLEYAKTLRSYTAEEAATAFRPVKTDFPPLSKTQRAAAEKMLPELGAEEFNKREAATRKLAALGKGVVPLLKAYSKKTNDPEILTRCRLLLRRFQPGKPVEYSLFERKPGAADITLIGPAFARAEVLGPYSRPTPMQGYVFKVLVKVRSRRSSWSDRAGNLTRGHGLVAFPAKYGRTGIHTFVVNVAGTVYRKDLGKKTNELGRKMTMYPDIRREKWKVAQ